MLLLGLALLSLFFVVSIGCGDDVIVFAVERMSKVIVVDVEAQVSVNKNSQEEGRKQILSWRGILLLIP